MSWGQNVDVICMCDARGQIRPLRVRLETEDQQFLRVDIDEILSTSSIKRLGAETETFLCKAKIWGRMRLFELRYTVRNHYWQITEVSF